MMNTKRAGMTHILIVALLLAPLAALSAGDPPCAIQLDPASPGRVFEGVGAVSAGASSRLLIDYPEPARSNILDWLFLPKYGAGFQHLKVEVGGEINSTDGTEPTHARSREELDTPRREYFERGYEWWLMKEAKKRNPQIILDCLPWGAPGWIGGGNYCSQDMADYLVGFLKGAKRFHDLDIVLVGCWNEKHVTPDWIKLLRRTLDAAGLARVKIVGGDMNGPPADQWKSPSRPPPIPSWRNAFTPSASTTRTAPSRRRRRTSDPPGFAPGPPSMASGIGPPCCRFFKARGQHEQHLPRARPHQDQFLEPGQRLLRLPARAPLGRHHRQHAVVGRVRYRADTLGRCAHHAICGAGLALPGWRGPKAAPRRQCRRLRRAEWQGNFPGHRNHGGQGRSDPRTRERQTALLPVRSTSGAPT